MVASEGGGDIPPLVGVHQHPVQEDDHAALTAGVVVIDRPDAGPELRHTTEL